MQFSHNLYRFHIFIVDRNEPLACLWGFPTKSPSDHDIHHFNILNHDSLPCFHQFWRLLAPWLRERGYVIHDPLKAQTSLTTSLMPCNYNVKHSYSFSNNKECEPGIGPRTIRTVVHYFQTWHFLQKSQLHLQEGTVKWPQMGQNFLIVVYLHKLPI
jgi:hypothetical protein